MTWTKLSDDYGDDCWTLSDEAFRLHTEGLIWSNRKLLDCLVPHEDVRRFAKHPEAIAELLDVGWWTDTGDAYVIRHHADYQRRREAVLKQQEINAANGRKGGRPRKGKGTGAPREQWNPETEPLTETQTEGDGTGRVGTGQQEQQQLQSAHASERDGIGDGDDLDAIFLRRSA